MREFREQDVETFPLLGGGWMARYDQDPRVASVAPTEEGARVALNVELDKWRDLLEGDGTVQ
jgi:hypothetical protein